MGRKSGIDWTDATWNPWYGCTKVSTGCKHCYAQRDMLRYGKNFDVVTKAQPGTFYSPDKWTDENLLIFVCSWSDFFHEAADEWRAEAWEIIKRNPQHTFQILTKRTERILEHLPPDWEYGYPNVWLGTSAADQHEADARMDELLAVPAKLHWVSVEPLVGPLNLINWLYKGGPRPGLKWVVVGGESGTGTEWRDMRHDWVDVLFEECQTFEIAFFFKQWAGRKKSDVENNRYKGKVWHEMPEVVKPDEKKQEALF